MENNEQMKIAAAEHTAEIAKTLTGSEYTDNKDIDTIDDADENSFPLYVFPQGVRDVINALNDKCLFPKDYVAAAIIFVVSVLIGAKSFLVTTLGKTYANIFIAIIGEQGSNKSAPIEWVIEPLLRADYESISKYKIAVEEWNNQFNKFNLTHNDGDKPGPYPKCKRYLCNDVTPEKLLRILADNPQGCGQYHDELSRLFNAVNRYNKGGNEDIFLSLFSGKPITVDRATTSDIVTVPHPYYCMIGTIQPERYIKLMAQNDRMESGLFARMLEVNHFSDPPLLWKLDEEYPSETEKQFADYMNCFIQRRDQSSTYEYRLSSEAASVIQDWQNDNENKNECNGRNVDRAVFRKIQIYVLKFALIIEIMWNIADNNENESNVISFRSAFFAKILADYFYNNVMELARTLSGSPLSKLERDIYEALPDSFTTAEGRMLAKNKGMGKTSFHAFINKIKGILITQPLRGCYVKKFPIKGGL